MQPDGRRDDLMLVFQLSAEQIGKVEVVPARTIGPVTVELQLLKSDANRQIEYSPSKITAALVQVNQRFPVEFESENHTLNKRAP